MNSNGESGRSWQLAFWLISVLCGCWLLALTNGVVANDRIRENHDLRIRESIEIIRSGIYDKLMSIDSRLSKIEAILERVK